jgi:hypothetical protein
MMLVFDSLTEKRVCVLNIWNASSLDPKCICEAQSQIIAAIDGWHQQLNLHWNTARYVQNLLFLCALMYAAAVWKDDTSADNSKVMAKIDELIGWLNASKSAPFDLLEKVKEVKPIFHICGHIHEAYGYIKQSGTEFINASVLDENYNLRNKPIVFEI